MKKFTFSFFMLLSAAAFAQRSTPVTHDFSGVKFTHHNDRSITDTLVPLSFTTALSCTLTVYGVVDSVGGYVVGNNGYGDKEKAQRYDITAYQLIEGQVTGVILWAGGKTVSGTPGNVVTKIYGVTSGAPGSLLGTSDPVSMDLIDTTNANGWTYFSFANPVTIPADDNFFASMQMSQVTGDTIGLVSSNDGCSENNGYSYEKWSNNEWHSFVDAWPLDFDIAIFPIINHNFGAGVNDVNSGIVAVNVFPNPASDNLTLNFALAKNSSVDCKIFNAAGMEVLNAGTETFNKGIHNKVIDLSSLSNGVYMLSMETSTGKSIQKITVVH